MQTQNIDVKRSQYRWSLEEVAELLRVYPHNSFLRLAATQLAAETDTDLGLDSTSAVGSDALPTRRINLLSLISGAAAIEESLQLNGLRGMQTDPQVNNDQLVDISSLPGPAAKNLPWQEMLGSKKPKITQLSRSVPSDFLIVECSSLRVLFDVAESAIDWANMTFNQVAKSAVGNPMLRRLSTQLYMADEVQRSSLDNLGLEVALVSSDLYIGEGSDMTLLMYSPQAEQLANQIREVVAIAQMEGVDVRRLSHCGVEILHVCDDKKGIDALFAQPAPGLHVRSNSLMAIQRVLEQVGNPDSSLGASHEFAYVRTLMPNDPEQADLFLFLSDAFIRRLVGPKLRLTEQRRAVCRANLKLLDQAAEFFAGQNGQLPVAIDRLDPSHSTILKSMSCPEGGTYGMVSRHGVPGGTCSMHGRFDAMVPCLELPLEKISRHEADEYERFIAEYNQYWTTLFDPIAVRCTVTEAAYKVETIVLPLIDNSVYTQLAMVVGGECAAFDEVPVPANNIFTTALQFNKELLLSQLGSPEQFSLPMLPGNQSGEVEKLQLGEFISEALSGQVSFNVCDSVPAFSLDISALLGLLTLRGQGVSALGKSWWIGFIAASLNAPVYLTLSLTDTRRADEFLERLFEFARTSNFGSVRAMNSQHYSYVLPEGTVGYCAAIRVGPLTLRFYYARIGQAICVASKESVLTALLAAESERHTKSIAAATADGHITVRFRRDNWRQVLGDVLVNQAETNRVACCNNLIALSSSHRAFMALSEQGISSGFETVESTSRFCPESGCYSTEGPNVICSVHGKPHSGKQPISSPQVSFMRDANAVTAALSFLQDGLHANLVIDRVPIGGR